MAKVSLYLNFPGTTKAAFDFYQTVFKNEFQGPVTYMKDVPPSSDMPTLSEAEQNMVIHIALPLLGDCVLMGADILPSQGIPVVFGSNISINLEPDTKEEADRLFSALSLNGTVEMPMQVMFWGDYSGALIDQYGVRWMINQTMKKV